MPRLTVKACGEVNTVLQLCKLILTVLAAFGISLVRCPWADSVQGCRYFLQRWLHGDTTEDIILVWLLGKLMFKEKKKDNSIFNSASFLKSVNSSTTDLAPM